MRLSSREACRNHVISGPDREIIVAAEFGCGVDRPPAIKHEEANMKEDRPGSLNEREIVTTRTGRRSAMVAIGAIVATAGLSTACTTGCSDSDTGLGRDPAGGGIRCRGCTDTDTTLACTDRDSTDRPGLGRSCTADGAGRGRRC